MKKTLIISVIALLVSCLAINLVAQEETGASEVVEGMEFKTDTDLISLLWKDAGEGFEAETIDVGGGAVYDKADNGNHIIELDGGKSYLDYEDKDGNKMILNNFKGDVEIDENGDIVKITGNVREVSELAMNFELEDSMGNEYDIPVNVPEGTNVNYDNGELALKGDKPFSVCQGNEGLAEGEILVSGKTCSDVNIDPVGAQDVTMNMGDDGRSIDLSCKGGCDLKIDDYNFETVDAAKGGDVSILDAEDNVYEINKGTVYEEKCLGQSCENVFSISTEEGSTEPLKVDLENCDGQIGADNFLCLDSVKGQGVFSGDFELDYENIKMYGDEGITGDFDANYERGTLVDFYDVPGFESESIIETNGREFTLTEEHTFLDDQQIIGEEFASEDSTVIVNPSRDEPGKFDVTEVMPDGTTEYYTDCGEDAILSWLGAAVVDVTGGAEAPIKSVTKPPTQQTNIPSDCPTGNTAPPLKNGRTIDDSDIRKLLDQKFRSTPEGAKLLKTISKAWGFTFPFVRWETFKAQPETKGFSKQDLERAMEIFDQEYRIKGTTQQASAQIPSGQ